MSPSIDQLLRKASRHAKRGEVKIAIQDYQSVLEKFPQNKRAAEGLKSVQQILMAVTASRDGFSEEQFNELTTLFNQGNFQEVLTRGGLLSKRFPNLPLIPNLLGAANANLGQIEQAAANFKKAIQLSPHYAEAHKNLGVAFNDLKKPREALASLKQALLLVPDYAEAYCNMGIAFNNLTEPEEAITCLKHALNLMPDYVEAHNQLGVTFNKLGENELAVESFKNALNFRPNYAKVHNNLGVALNGLGRPEEAVASYENALRIAPNYAEAHNNLGAVLSRLGKSESAVDSFKTALNLDPAYAEAHNNLGIILTHLGNSKEAVASFNNSIQLRPDHAKAHYGLSKIKTYQPNDPDIVQMLDTLQSDTVSSRDQIYLNYSLAKAYADIGDHDNSFTYLAAGNRLDKERSTWSAVSERELFASIKLKFEHESLSHVDPETLGEFGSKHPIFILGMPRSGTTLVEQILASHSQVFGAGELEFLSRSILLDDLTLSHDVELETNTIRNKYLSHLIKLEAREKYVTDKNPLNFRFIGYILQSFPESKIIHVRRDARATCWSIFRHHFPRFSARQSFIYDLEDVVEYYKLYADLMSFWHNKFPGKIYDLTYESLTENQIRETRSLLEHLDLEWEDRCLEFYKTQRAVKTASSLQVRQEMYRGSSEEWRKFEVHLEPMIEALQMY